MFSFGSSGLKQTWFQMRHKIGAIIGQQLSAQHSSYQPHCSGLDRNSFAGPCAAMDVACYDGSLLDRGLRHRIATLQHIPLFRKCSDSLMYRIAGKLRRRYVAVGEALAHEGERCDCIYLLEDGHVQLWGDDEESAGLSGPCGIIGDPRILLDPLDKLWQYNCISRRKGLRS